MFCHDKTIGNHNFDQPNEKFWWKNNGEIDVRAEIGRKFPSCPLKTKMKGLLGGRTKGIHNPSNWGGVWYMVPHQPGWWWYGGTINQELLQTNQLMSLLTTNSWFCSLPNHELLTTTKTEDARDYSRSTHQLVASKLWVATEQLMGQLPTNESPQTNSCVIY